jgi:GH24 family phage-related lysozyme (muramidase)
MKWTKARDSKTGTLKTLKGLVKRREAEANLYFA